jgi:hypothetical protein
MLRVAPPTLSHRHTLKLYAASAAVVGGDRGVICCGGTLSRLAVNTGAVSE